MKMNLDIAKRWVERLRSLPPEAQGQGHLNQGGKMCCLGVLCEIAFEDGATDKVPDQMSVTSYMYGTDHKDWSYLPTSVIEWASIEDQRPFNPTIEGYPAGSWNDDAGKSFNQIADLIEKELGL